MKKVLIVVLLFLFLPIKVHAQTEELQIFQPMYDDNYYELLAKKGIDYDQNMRYIPDGVYYTLPVPVFEQTNDYYCGPASVKQVIHFINGTSASMDTYAKQLGTTTAGTVMYYIDDVLKTNTGKNYIYTSIHSGYNWEYKIEYGMKNNMPAVLGINTVNSSAFPYRSSGHFVNTSGYDTKYNNSVRITDPYGPGLGNKWYTIPELYNANDAHFRESIIW